MQLTPAHIEELNELNEKFSTCYDFHLKIELLDEKERVSVTFVYKDKIVGEFFLHEGWSEEING